MSFPSSPANGATAVVNGVLYTYNSTNDSWTRTSQGQSNSNIVFTNGTQTITGVKTFTANTTVSADLIVDTNTLVVDSVNNRTGLGTSSPAATLDISGTTAQNYQTTTGTMDLSTGQVFTITTGAATTFSFTNVPASRSTTVVLHITNGGSQTLTWPSNVATSKVYWPGGTAPTLTSAGTDILVFHTVDGGISWDGNLFAKDVK